MLVLSLGRLLYTFLYLKIQEDFQVIFDLSKAGFRIRIQEGKNDPKKNWKKDRIFIFWSAGCSLLRAEGSPVAWGSFLEALG